MKALDAQIDALSVTAAQLRAYEAIYYDDERLQGEGRSLERFLSGEAKADALIKTAKGPAAATSWYRRQQPYPCVPVWLDVGCTLRQAEAVLALLRQSTVILNIPCTMGGSGTVGYHTDVDAIEAMVDDSKNSLYLEAACRDGSGHLLSAKHLTSRNLELEDQRATITVTNAAGKRVGAVVPFRTESESPLLDRDDDNGLFYTLLLPGVREEVFVAVTLKGCEVRGSRVRVAPWLPVREAMRGSGVLAAVGDEVLAAFVAALEGWLAVPVSAPTADEGADTHSSAQLIAALLYRGSRDGMTAADFHRYCDRKGPPTLTLIRSVNG
ncbi:MAG: hypothetical protein P4L40_05650, partial [Terracidiphilus sp.]|nr:hypothetical protein [Terracidiphilus sp.]